jgi:hypothetical protein
MEPSQLALWEAQLRNVELPDGDIHHRLLMSCPLLLRSTLLCHHLVLCHRKALCHHLVLCHQKVLCHLMVEGFHQTKHRMQTSLHPLLGSSRLDRHNNPKQRCVYDSMMNFHLRMPQKEVLTLHQVQQCGDEVS